MSAEPTTEKKPGMLDPQANLKALVRILAIVAIVIGVIWLVVRLTGGEKAANRTTAAILQRPIQLKDSVENLPASSFRGFPLSLPYTGTLTVEAKVMKGNEIGLYLVQPDQIENLKSKRKFSSFEEFEAQKTKSYRRSGRVKAGEYYFVAVDTTMGILSAASTDIQIRARLEP